MEKPRLIQSSIHLSFSKSLELNSDIFRDEYRKMAEVDDDPVGTWLKMATARGDTRDSDKVLLTLITELHRKLNDISDKLDKRDKSRVKLEENADIDSIGFGYFRLEKPCLKIGTKYYGRIDMPTFPQREVPLYFEAQDERLAKILIMHDRDVKDWDAYVASRERVMIREAKERE
jgi:hypothetical protein